MRRLVIIAAVAAGAFALPGVASANGGGAGNYQGAEGPGADKQQSSDHGDCKNPGHKGDTQDTTGIHNGYDCSRDEEKSPPHGDDDEGSPPPQACCPRPQPQPQPCSCPAPPPPPPPTCCPCSRPKHKHHKHHHHHKAHHKKKHHHKRKRPVPHFAG